MNLFPKTSLRVLMIALVGVGVIAPARGQSGISETIISTEPPPVTSGSLGTILGMVRDRTGKDLPTMEVRAFSGDKELSMVHTDPSGDFVLSDLPLDRTITIKASAPFFCQDSLCSRRLCRIEPRASVRVYMRNAGGIEGKITDEAGKPIASAVVSVDGHTSRSSQAGAFGLVDLPSGRHDIFVSAPGYCLARVEKIYVAPGRMTAEVNIGMQRGVSVRGRVVSLAAGKEIPEVGATVVAHPDRFPMSTTATTSADGSFSFDRQAPGITSFNAWKGMRAGNISAETTSTAPLVVKLPIGVTMSGIVAGRGGVPIKAARITLKPDSPFFGQAQSAMSDAHGAFGIRDLDIEGRYWLTIEADGYAPRFEQVLAGGLEPGKRYELKDTGGFTGRVMHGDTRVPVADFTVVAALANGMSWKGKTNAAGEFRIDGLAGGEFYIGGRRAASQKNKDELNEPPLTAEPLVNQRHAYGEWEKVELRAWPAPTLTGTVNDSKEMPIRAATVIFENENFKNAPIMMRIPEFGLRASAETDSSGRYQIDIIHRGTLEGRAYKDGFVEHYPSHMEIFNTDPRFPIVDPSTKPKTIDTRFGQERNAFDFELLDAAEDPSEGIEVTEGQVVDQDQKPVAGIEVQRSVQRTGPRGMTNEINTAITDEDGRFAFETKRYESYYGSGSLMVRPTAAMPYYGQGLNDGVMRVRRCGEIHGVVVDGQGRPVGNAHVYLLKHDADLLDSLPEQDSEVVTDSAGKFKFEMVLPGSHRVQAGRPIYGAPPGESVPCEIKSGEARKDIKLIQKADTKQN